MATAIYKGTEGKVYIQDPDGEHSLIPDSGLSATAPAAANQVGRVEGFTVRLENGVEAYFGMGARDATDVKEGLRQVSGTISRALINGLLCSAALGTVSGSSPYPIVANTRDELTAFELELFFTQGTNYVGIWVEKVKFDTWEVSPSNDGSTVIENLDWIGVFKSGQFVGVPATGV